MSEQGLSARAALLHKIRRCVAHIVVLDQGEVISQGSGFCFNAAGQILTAAHTVAGGWPIKSGEVDQRSRQIIVRLVGQSRTLIYRPIVCPITIAMQSDRVEPIALDIAVLQPIEKQDQAFEFLPNLTQRPILGDEYFLAGYSDEIEFPFVACPTSRYQGLR